MAISINKQQDGTYSVRVWSKVFDAFGKRKTKYKSNFKSVTTAQKWAELKEDELTELTLQEIDPINKEITFNELNKLYLEARENKMSPTSFNYAKNITPRIEKFMGRIKAKDINTRIVQKFVDELSNETNKYKPNQKLKAGTIERYVNHIKAVINWGVSQDYLEYNKIKRIEYPIEEEPFIATTLTAEDAGKVLSWLKTNYYNIYIPVLLSVTMSPRRGEFAGLTWDKIDFNNDTIELSNNRVMIGSTYIDKKHLKTKSSKRILVMSDFVKNELLEHKKMCAGLESQLVCANVFSNETPTNPYYITRAFHKVMEDEFGIKMRLHDLRQTFSQISYEDDIDEVTRSKIMGHSNTKITRNVYTRASLKKNKDVMNIISNDIENAFKN